MHNWTTLKAVVLFQILQHWVQVLNHIPLETWNMYSSVQTLTQSKCLNLCMGHGQTHAGSAFNIYMCGIPARLVLDPTQLTRINWSGALLGFGWSGVKVSLVHSCSINCKHYPCYLRIQKVGSAHLVVAPLDRPQCHSQLWIPFYAQFLNRDLGNFSLSWIGVGSGWNLTEELNMYHFQKELPPPIELCLWQFTCRT